MADQMTSAEMRKTAKRLRHQKLIPRNEGSPMDRDLRAGADALDRLADVIEYTEDMYGGEGMGEYLVDCDAGSVWRIAAGTPPTRTGASDDRLR